MCNKAKEWQKDISCLDVADFDDEEDIDNTQPLILRPAYPVPAKGFSKSIVIRANKSLRLADIYYQSPTGNTLRSMVQVNSYLNSHPEFHEVDRNTFCFAMPPKFSSSANLASYSIYTLCGSIIQQYLETMRRQET